MRAKVVHLAAVLACALLIVWGVTITFDLQNPAIQYLKIYPVETVQTELIDASKLCSLSETCPAESYPFHIWSGAANVVGPKICFNGKIIMSHVLNNVYTGINIVQINEERGVVENHGSFNLVNGNPADILNYLKEIKPGSIVLVASFTDISPKLTEEIMDIFEKMGSSMIRKVKSHDNWVFAGKTEAKERSLFEKLVPNDPQTNLYDDWPRVADLSGCLLKSQFFNQREDSEAQAKLK